MALAFAATASRPTAVLSGPLRAAGDQAIADVRRQPGDAYDMVRVRLDGHLLTGRAAVAWSGDLPRHLQQVLFDTADARVATASVGRWPPTEAPKRIVSQALATAPNATGDQT